MTGPIPKGWHSVTPRLVVHNPGKLVEFLKQAFGATGDFRTDIPSVIRIGDSLVMVSSVGSRDPMPAFLYLYVDDIDATYRRALKAGAVSLEEPQDMPYGDRRGMIKDPCGNTWQIATPKEDVSGDVSATQEVNDADPMQCGGRLNGNVGRTRSDPMRTDDSYDGRVAQTLADLGIPASYGVDRNMPSYAEPKDLVSVGMDIYGRDRQLTPHAAGRWTELRTAAHQDGIALLLVSAFRSLEYQRQIFERKLRAGESLERILKVNAPPGYSEHHTGSAVDLTTPGCPPLAEEFETTAAFAWLVRHAHRFGFAMTYPRENRFGLAYEPWHWAVQE